MKSLPLEIFPVSLPYIDKYKHYKHFKSLNTKQSTSHPGCSLSVWTERWKLWSLSLYKQINKNVKTRKNRNELNLNVFSSDINLPDVCLTKTLYFNNGNEVFFTFLHQAYIRDREGRKGWGKAEPAEIWNISQYCLQTLLIDCHSHSVLDKYEYPASHPPRTISDTKTLHNSMAVN